MIKTPPIPITEEVEYNHALHRYSYRERIYRSATQIVEQFVEPFDTIERSQYMADRYGETPEYWRLRWKSGNQVSLDRGTMIHEQKEDYLHSRGVDAINEKQFRVYNLEAPIYAHHKTDYRTLPDGVYPELMLWRHDWGIAGRADKPILDSVFGTTTRIAHIEDYKTNKRVRTEGWLYRDGTRQMMLGPISHLQDCELIHYTLQMSLYQFMLEYFNFIPGHRRLIYIPHPIEGIGQPRTQIIELPYLKQEVLMMLHHLKKQGWLQ